MRQLLLFGSTFNLQDVPREEKEFIELNEFVTCLAGGKQQKVGRFLS